MSTLSIFTDKPFYQPGDLVTGKVAIHLEKTPVDPIKLELACTGAVEVTFPYEKLVGTLTRIEIVGNPPAPVPHSIPIMKRVKAKEARSLFQLEAEQTLAPKVGQTDVIVPFEVRLPEDLPASFNIRQDEKDNPGASAVVAYKLSCTMTSADCVSTVSEDFVVAQVPQTSQNEISKPVSLFRCISQGQLSCTIQLNKCFYVPGEGIALSLILDAEKSTSSFHRVHVSLLQGLTLKADGQTRQLTRTILKYKFDGIKWVNEQMILTLPKELECSTSGELIESVYQLQVKFKRRLGTDIVFECPVQVQMAPSASLMKGRFQEYEPQPLNLLVLK